MAGHELARPLELVRGLVELLLMEVQDAKVVVGGTVEEVLRQRLTEQRLRLRRVFVRDVRSLTRELLCLDGRARRLCRRAVGGRGGRPASGERRGGERRESSKVEERITLVRRKTKNLALVSVFCWVEKSAPRNGISPSSGTRVLSFVSVFSSKPPTTTVYPSGTLTVLWSLFSCRGGGSVGRDGAPVKDDSEIE
jgi:hypothetical protein